MALCSSCQSIPFDNLPEFPEYDGRVRIADRTNLPRYRGNPDKYGGQDTPLGFPWQESLESLANSAKLGCPLCIILQAGAQIWLDTYQDAAATNKLFVEFHQEKEPIPHGQTLWLTKRVGGGDGFSVVVRNPEIRHYFALLTGVSFSVDSDHALAQRFLLRPVQSDSGSPRSLDVAAAWVANCAQNHENCAGRDTLLPSRLLDVGSSSDIIKLVEPEAGSMGKYASLSHCWGSSMPLTTTRQSREARMSGFSITELPKTFHDAVVIARHLGIRFLWIDSLCIYQDDRSDWARESANMTAVYSNAHVVIAASRAIDSNAGCFHTRPVRPSSTISVPGAGNICVQLVYNENECPWQTDFEGEPLSDRGWALQETVLAKRALYFNKTQMYFECNEGRVSEDGFRSAPPYARRTLRLNQAGERSIAEDRHMWNRLLWEYGERKLTHATDKLPAMSGLAKLFATRFGARYVAGLWSDALIQGLTWQCIATQAPMSTTEYVAPSWSWASYAGIPAISWQDHRWGELAEVVDWHSELQDEENPYGAVKNAWIRIHAPMAQLIPSETSDLSEVEEGKRLRAGLRAPARVRISGSGDQEKADYVVFDHETAHLSGEWHKWDLHYLVLAGVEDSRQGENRQKDTKEAVSEKSKEAKRMDFYYCLIVVPTGERGLSQWKRVGWGYCDGKKADELREDKVSWKTITLV